uniref:Butyrophilin subfamily 3 member A1-like n=1 Tax=Geotrypetes seraphini TaxID=260995 RepID=A0A6P8P8G2_GEOSA|nr:butyrophilin subfamily 3 member A1-like [Geotrypetes seraphini]XP_033771268.1 butyrophilin subfamily 3 member A1-like [Geotrypetes seraphini]XP_033771269.1 butyrophilin subfamily 3 member A1-like [Geotrypetes seraphini]XP_033771270.1 butyrophilin subfamily 3 member A1-like [Geotrypetes seraphini]
MARNVLLRHLEELLMAEFNKFKTSLGDVPLMEGYSNIPRSKTEKADATEIARLMIQYYGEEYAPEVAVHILHEINKKDLSSKLRDAISVSSERSEERVMKVGTTAPFASKRRRNEVTVKANVILNPDTAFPTLLLSDDGKSVRLGKIAQNLPNNPERFDFRPCVLGMEGFTTGRHEWKVEVGSGVCWTLGVASAASERKGYLYMSPEEGFWVLEKSDNTLRALTFPRTPLSHRQIPEKILISLDYERGHLTFFDANEFTTILYMFGYPFRDQLFPFFMTWDQQIPIRIL